MTKSGSKKDIEKNLGEEVKRRRSLLKKSPAKDASALRLARKKLKRAQRKLSKHKAQVARFAKKPAKEEAPPAPPATPAS